MNFKVVTLPGFEKSTKKLTKKYPSLKNDLLELVGNLEKNPVQGTPLGNDFYKIRVSIKSKGKGKSGGSRVITCVKIIKAVVYLSAIYDKSEQSSVTDAELKFFAKQINVL